MTMVFMHGFVLALGLILPLGVQNLFVFQQGIAQVKLWRVLPVIVTAAACDTVLIILSVSGISILIMQFRVLRVVLMSAGIVFLIYMGCKIWTDKSGLLNEKEEMLGLSMRKQIMFAMSVSFLNPYAFMDIIGVIGTSSIEYQGIEKLWFSAACISVSWLWFLLLGVGGHYLGRLHLLEGVLVRLNKASAVFIWGTAGYMVYMMKW